MSADKPLALVLADRIDVWLNTSESGRDSRLYECAAELRRLHASNAALVEALEDVMYWSNGKHEWAEAAAVLKAAKEARNG